jgi:hypothetical protein
MAHAHKHTELKPYLKEQYIINMFTEHFILYTLKLFCNNYFDNRFKQLHFTVDNMQFLSHSRLKVF